jgi:choline dehydrogenase
MAPLSGFWLLLAGVPLFLNSSLAAPLHARSAQIKRQASDLESHYDYIVVGGGTSGLTVANRLTAAFPNRTG